MNELVTVEAICERYGIERHAAGRLLKKIPHFRVGNKAFVREQDLIDWEMSRMKYPVQLVTTPQTTERIERRKN